MEYGKDDVISFPGLYYSGQDSILQSNLLCLAAYEEASCFKSYSHKKINYANNQHEHGSEPFLSQASR